MNILSIFAQPPAGEHVPGTTRGETLVRRHGREPGRDKRKAGRTARDSTSIDPEGREPIDPRMPSLPPA
jgi:hypothetical protein